MHILDHNGEAFPVEMIRETYVARASVALGYLNQCVLNQVMSLLDPYATLGDRAYGWETMYKTRDKGWLTDNGELIFMGSIEGDNEVKLRDQRVELDEVALDCL
ncbi:hypothetical protein K431DRAFT_295170 [Polychaeton citri CBS 116435]|uniref:Uncharacterized protein n=1 Tax=Polychaeton citri CBS 116435 TaxID=1314669 RepID=A0A9P4UP70_9PEZI|nr:hypothetical protein K431DRAFT_295170 [Polychaeton citri CBS 116435]